MRLTPRKVIQWLMVALLIVFIISFYTQNSNDNAKVVHFAENANDIDQLDLNYATHAVTNELSKRDAVAERLYVERLDNLDFVPKSYRITRIDDIFISIKTTQEFHRTRLKILLETWIESAKAQTYVFTDTYDAEVDLAMGGHLINTSCSMEHNRRALCCKMAMEYDFFIESGKRWFCHVDDDTYLNTHALVSVLQSYPHMEDWYLGRPSMTHPIEIIDRDNGEVKVAFWFATGGAGFCISRSLALKMMPYTSGGRLMTVGDKIRLPDDCTIGYIIEHLLGKKLTVMDRFHSHLEALVLLKPDKLKHDISFSYSNYSGKWNTVKIPGPTFPLTHDPTRLLSLHCYLHPHLPRCLSPHRRS